MGGIPNTGSVTKFKSWLDSFETDPARVGFLFALLGRLSGSGKVFKFMNLSDPDNQIN